MTVIHSADQGDWVDSYMLDIPLLINPFYAGYLNITSILFLIFKVINYIYDYHNNK